MHSTTVGHPRSSHSCHLNLVVHIPLCISEFFAGALMNDKSLQSPMHHAHVDAALTGEGEVHIAELPDEGVVGVAVW